MSGQKFDQGKPKLSLLPTLALFETAKGMSVGAEKYGKYNYLDGMEYTRLLDAAQRHILKFQAGEVYDIETGLHHLAHASCCCLMLLEYVLRGRGVDDRFLSDAVAFSDDSSFEVNGRRLSIDGSEFKKKAIKATISNLKEKGYFNNDK